MKGGTGLQGPLRVSGECVHQRQRGGRARHPIRGARAADIVSIDVGVKQGGWCADSAFTFPVGEIGPEAARLLEVTRRAPDAAVAAIAGYTSETSVRRWSRRCARAAAIIRDLVGHGIGRAIHEEPQVKHRPRRLRRSAPAGDGPRDRAHAGGHRRDPPLSDRWTVTSLDGSLSAHFEHTVAVTEAGPRILRAVPSGTPGNGGGAGCSGRDRGCRPAIVGYPFKLCPEGRGWDPVSRDMNERGAGAKVRTSVKPMCEYCRVVRRKGVADHLQPESAHKQRQG